MVNAGRKQRTNFERILLEKPYFSLIIALGNAYYGDNILKNNKNKGVTYSDLKALYEKYNINYESGNISRYLNILFDEHILIIESNPKRHYSLNPIGFSVFISKATEYLYEDIVGNKIELNIYKYFSETIISESAKISHTLLNFIDSKVKKVKKIKLKAKDIIIQTAIPIYYHILEDNFIFNSKLTMKDFIFIWIEHILKKDLSFTLKDLKNLNKLNQINDEKYAKFLTLYNDKSFYSVMSEVIGHTNIKKNSLKYEFYNLLESVEVSSMEYVECCKKIVLGKNKLSLIFELLRCELPK